VYAEVSGFNPLVPKLLIGCVRMPISTSDTKGSATPRRLGDPSAVFLGRRSQTKGRKNRAFRREIMGTWLTRNGVSKGIRTLDNWSHRAEGGGPSDCDGTIEDKQIRENWADSKGGGLYNGAGTIRNNVIADNVAGKDGSGYVGGGLSSSYPLTSNTISRNTATQDGGGLYAFQGDKIQNCI
jgi:hypothetical protein